MVFNPLQLQANNTFCLCCHKGIYELLSKPTGFFFRGVANNKLYRNRVNEITCQSHKCAFINYPAGIENVKKNSY